MKLNAQVKCVITQRNSKAYAKYGTPATAGAKGVVVRINALKDVTIVEFQTERGIVHAHIQNLIVQ
jgi:hypothetical protein